MFLKYLFSCDFLKYKTKEIGPNKDIPTRMFDMNPNQKRLNNYNKISWINPMSNKSKS
jgi:hypothetical protein